MSHVFRFRHSWPVAAAPSRVYDVLADAEHYDRWWPQVRQIRAVDEESGEVEVRSILPLALHLRLVRVLADPVSRRLRVAIHGDLEGWAEWAVRAERPGRRGLASSRAHFTQEVLLVRPRLGRLATVASPVLRLNHAWMMSSGRRGLAGQAIREESRIVTIP